MKQLIGFYNNTELIAAFYSENAEVEIEKMNAKLTSNKHEVGYMFAILESDFGLTDFICSKEEFNEWLFG